MILSIPRASGHIRHFDNIVDIHNNQPAVLKAIDAFDPMYAGGYAMALMFAPRIQKTVIETGYFGDYDVYFPDTLNLQLATEYLTSQVELNDNNSVYETENAVTYKIEDESSPGKFAQIQIVKLLHGSPESILKTFDFVNCAIGFTPKSSTIHFHSEAPKFHIDRKLEILEPWMIDSIDIEDPLTDPNVIVQLMRFKKYCLRWNYSLAEKAFYKLYQLYIKKPDIKIQANQTYLVHGGPYDRQAYIGLANQNVWTAIAPIMVDNAYWNNSLDIHNLMSNSHNLIYEQLEISEPIQPISENRQTTSVLTDETETIPL